MVDIEWLRERCDKRQYPFCGNCYMYGTTEQPHCDECHPKAVIHEINWRKEYAFNG